MASSRRVTCAAVGSTSALGVFLLPAVAQPCGPIGGWVPTFDEGLNGRVSTMIRMPNGDIVASGGRTLPNGNIAGRMARWNGVRWNTMVDFDTNSGVLAYALLPNGDLLAAGGFQTIGGVAAANIARFDGTTWHPMGIGLDEGVTCIQVMPNGDIYAGGWFDLIPGASGRSRGLARWDGATWSSPGNVVGSLSSMALLNNGNLIVAGSFGSVGNVPANNIARWDGSAWSRLDFGTLGFVHALCPLQNGGVAVGGSFARLGDGRTCNFIAQWHPTTGWGLMGGGTQSDVFTIAQAPGGELLVGGRFLNAFQALGSFVATYDGSAWHGLGGGTDQFVFSTLVMPAAQGSEFVIGGQFMTAGDQPANGFARYSRSGRPWVAVSPTADGWTCAGGTIELSVTPATGYQNIEYLWRRDGTPLEDGVTPWGSMIKGSLTAELVISGAGAGDAGAYDCFIANVCGVASSRSAQVQVCRADFLCDRTVDSRDFFAYVGAFFKGDTGADMTGDGSVGAEDFFEFVTTFLAGC